MPIAGVAPVLVAHPAASPHATTEHSPSPARSEAYGSSSEEYDPRPRETVMPAGAGFDPDGIDGTDGDEDLRQSLEEERASLEHERAAGAPLLSPDADDSDEYEDPFNSQEPHEPVARPDLTSYPTVTPKIALATPGASAGDRGSFIEPTDEMALWTKFQEFGPASSVSDLSHGENADSSAVSENNALSSIGAALVNDTEASVNGSRGGLSRNASSTSSNEVPRYPSKRQAGRRAAPPTPPTRVARIPVPEVSRAYAEIPNRTLAGPSDW